MQDRNDGPLAADPDPLSLDTASLDVFTLVPVVGQPGDYTAVFPDGSYARWTPPPGRKRGRHRAVIPQAWNLSGVAVVVLSALDALDLLSAATL